LGYDGIVDKLDIESAKLLFLLSCG